RQATAATARVAELRDELERARRQHDDALSSSDATVRALSERLRQADAELARLRSQVAAGSAAPYPAASPSLSTRQPRPRRRWPARARAPARPARAPPVPAALPPAPVTAPSRRRSAGAWFLDAFLVAAAMWFVLLAVAAHPAVVRTLLPEPQRSANRHSTG